MNIETKFEVGDIVLFKKGTRETSSQNEINLQWTKGVVTFVPDHKRWVQVDSRGVKICLTDPELTRCEGKAHKLLILDLDLDDNVVAAFKAAAEEMGVIVHAESFGNIPTDQLDKRIREIYETPLEIDGHTSYGYACAFASTKHSVLYPETRRFDTHILSTGNLMGYNVKNLLKDIPSMTNKFLHDAFFVDCPSC